MKFSFSVFSLLGLYHITRASPAPFISDVNFELSEIGPPSARLPLRNPKPFNHPGLLHTPQDFERIKRQTQRGGWVEKRAYEQFINNEYSDPDHALKGPYKRVIREFSGKYEPSMVDFMKDSEAARQLALLWAIDGNEKAGRKAVKILDAWGTELKECTGNGAQLLASLTGSVMLQAAEIMRYTSNFWEEDSIRRFENMLRTALLPRIMQTRPNFELKYPFSGNWGTSALRAMVASAIFLDDHELYRISKNAILYSPCANLTGIISPTGQSSDHGRDQQHTQLGLGSLAEAFQMLWNQGDDFYSAAGNRLMAGLEYQAKFTGGYDVPYDPNFYTCHTNVLGGPWKKISTIGRYDARPIYEMAYAHYTLVKGLKMPWTEKLIKRHTPDGPNIDNNLTDGSSFQTFLFRREESTELNRQYYSD